MYSAQDLSTMEHLRSQMYPRRPWAEPIICLLLLAGPDLGSIIGNATYFGQRDIKYFLDDPIADGVQPYLGIGLANAPQSRIGYLVIRPTCVHLQLTRGRRYVTVCITTDIRQLLVDHYTHILGVYRPQSSWHDSFPR